MSRYTGLVVFKKKKGDQLYTYKGSKKAFFDNDTEYNNAVELHFGSDQEYKSNKWWDEASNAVLDSMDGTDWSNVLKTQWYEG